ncbi:(E)-beta-caryophyllene synthase-like [Phragmites australis]|uniref:(E)-beta-caryophyllene synthase-like n=1 Tax=Phragmites australis TaxID=29695 RepID=UPI002D79D70B|nr:(E)-beta-caryophyllene synthase-like [Phragmites australis]
MATTITICSPAAPASQHSRRQYPPSIWGDFFLTHQPCTPAELLSMKEKAQAKEEEVRRIVLDAAASDDLARKLDLVDALQRLGVDYHYKKDIDELLRAVYDDKDGGSDDLYVTSLRFYLLRKHGYAVSSDVFVKFRDKQGNISSGDVNSLLTLYDAAHLRTRGGNILDNIITFNKTRLQSVMKTNLEPDLVEEVRITLETPRLRRVERVEARRFISVYEKKAARDDTILEFAKLDYHILQVLYCKELKELTIWWKDFKSRTDAMRFGRDRMVETYFWMMAIVYEPYYSYSRIMLTKLTLFLALMDDVCDNYTSTEESNIFTTAMERWDEKAMEQLPANLRAFYNNLLGNIDGIVEDLKVQNNKNAEAVRRMVIDAAKCFHAELKWRDEHYTPTDVEEHLQISMGSIVAMQTANLVFIALGNVTTMEAVEWAFAYPKIIRGVCIHARISNDIMSHEREQASEHMASTVQTCMKQYGVTVEETNEKLRVIIDEAWMDMVQECLDQEHPMALLEKVIAFAQSIDFVYKRVDSYTLSSNLKDTLTSLYVKFV